MKLGGSKPKKRRSKISGLKNQQKCFLTTVFSYFTQLVMKNATIPHRVRTLITQSSKGRRRFQGISIDFAAKDSN